MDINAIDTNTVMPGLAYEANAPKQDRYRPSPVAGETAVSNEQMRQMIAEMQSQIERMNVSLQFSTYGNHGERIAVVVTDKQTGEVIREIPPKELQGLYAKMSELSGIIFNKQI
jgi:flagellar protein FlaG